MADRAQKVVTDMHAKMAEQTKRIAELEGMVKHLQNLCVSPIEQEIRRLERHKEQLQKELHEVDSSILMNYQLLAEVKGVINKALAEDIPLSTPDDSSHHSNSSRLRTGSDLSSHAHDLIRIQPPMQCLTEVREEDMELISQVRRIAPDMLFMLHNSNSDEIIIFNPPGQDTDFAALLEVYRLETLDTSTTPTVLSAYEKMMAYGPRTIPNHERDDPEVMELPTPKFFTFDNELANHPNSELMGAVELPILPDVAIDIWQCETSHKHFATTSIDGVHFALLEKIRVVSEVRWGFTTIVSVELLGRNCISGIILEESIKITA